jgi:hypothetical protein
MSRGIIRLQRRKDIDEVKEPDSEILIGHGPLQNPADPSSCVESRGHVGDGGIDPEADTSYLLLDGGSLFHDHNSIMHSPAETHKKRRSSVGQ